MGSVADMAARRCMGRMGCMSAGYCMGRCMGCMGGADAWESCGLLLGGNVCGLGMSSDDGQGGSGAPPMHPRHAFAPGPAADSTYSSSPVEVPVSTCCRRRRRRQMGRSQGDGDVRCRLIEPRADEELGHRLGLGGKATGRGGARFRRGSCRLVEP